LTRYRAASIVPADDADLPYVTRALHVGTAGDLTVTLSGGQTVTFATLSAGWHPIRVARVHATGTTADGIVGAW
jgi:hypothetical protein